MNIPPISKIFSNGISKFGGAIANRAMNSSKSLNKFASATDKLEFTGMNYSFAGMSAIMIAVVLVKRLLEALKRNPDDKKATRDEFEEIAFRDVQTIAIMLFLLNGINASLAGKKTAQTGLPMTDKPFNKIFNNPDGYEKGIKGTVEKTKEFFKNPLENAKKAGGNFAKAFNPLGGVNSLTNEEISSRYSNFKSIDQIKKMLNSLNGNGGNDEKVFKGILDDIISKTQSTLNDLNRQALETNSIQNGKIVNSDYASKIKGAKEMLEELNALKEKGTKGLDDLIQNTDDETKTNVSTMIVNYLKDPNNALVKKAQGLNAVLRTGALIFEATYLGFGLPALNKLRLKKKYLSNNDNSIEKNTQAQQARRQGKNSAFQQSFNSKEAKIFKSFVG